MQIWENFGSFAITYLILVSSFQVKVFVDFLDKVFSFVV